MSLCHGGHATFIPWFSVVRRVHFGKLWLQFIALDCNWSNQSLTQTSVTIRKKFKNRNQLQLRRCNYILSFTPERLIMKVFVSHSSSVPTGNGPNKSSDPAIIPGHPWSWVAERRVESRPTSRPASTWRCQTGQTKRDILTSVFLTSSRLGVNKRCISIKKENIQDRFRMNVSEFNVVKLPGDYVIKLQQPMEKLIQRVC